MKSKSEQRRLEEQIAAQRVENERLEKDFNEWRNEALRLRVEAKDEITRLRRERDEARRDYDCHHLAARAEQAEREREEACRSVASAVEAERRAVRKAEARVWEYQEAASGLIGGWRDDVPDDKPVTVLFGPIRKLRELAQLVIDLYEQGGNDVTPAEYEDARAALEKGDG